jgi:hypothetical protein
MATSFWEDVILIERVRAGLRQHIDVLDLLSSRSGWPELIPVFVGRA